MRFYGGSPVMWLTDVPMCVVNAHLSMLGQLTAEESKSAATIAWVGHSMKPGRLASRQISVWESAMRRNREGASSIPRNAGIKVIRHG